MSIKSIRLQNFKGFKDAKIDLKPLTVLIGPNSSGKSSFGQALVALSKNKPTGGGFIPTLDFTDERLFKQPHSIDFGNYKELVHSSSDSKKVMVELELETFGKLKYGFGGEVANNPKTRIKELELTYLEIEDKRKESKTDDIHVHNALTATTTEVITTEIVPAEPTKEPSGRRNSIIFERDFKSIWTTTSEKGERETYKLFFDGFSIEGAFHLTGTQVELRQFLSVDIISEASSLLDKVSYLRPDRAAPLRVDVNSPSSAGAEIDDWGNGIGWFIDEKSKDDVDTFWFPRPTPNKEEAEKELALYRNAASKPVKFKKALSKWIEIIGLASSIDTKFLKGEHAIQTLAIPPNQEVPRPLTDLGFGVSQVLPILAKGLTLEKGGLLVVEQPEAQLHPKPQAELADFFCSLVKCGRNSIVETHSPDFFHRLRLRASMDPELADNIAVYFFHESEEDQCCEPERIFLDEQAELKWPKGFLPEGVKTEMEILAMRLARKRDGK